MAHSRRTLIVPITALRRSVGSYPFKLIELINQLNLAQQFGFCSHGGARNKRLQTVEYRGSLVEELHQALIRYTRIVW